ncbi:Serine/threonine-protein kinase, variant 4 [Entomophthora muscae]|nr:Serine/threonine-protein kinase, variant 4 [Entomophthora muscae]
MKHPNITELYEIKRTETKVCLIMELCSFGDLSEYIKKNRLKPGTGSPAGGLSEVIFRHFLLQLVSAFKFLRGKDLVHRDLKPQNILLSQPTADGSASATDMVNYTDTLPQLKVADFGFAKILPSQALTETACGSPLYMAPEVLKKNKYNASADLWSIGTVLYEMVTGRAPFRASDTKELQRRIEQGADHIWFPGEPIDIPNSPQLQDLGDAALSFGIDENLVSADIKDLIRGLLVRDPEQRISFQDFFSHPAVRSFEAPPKPVLSKPKPNFHSFTLQNSQSKFSIDEGLLTPSSSDIKELHFPIAQERPRLKHTTSSNRSNDQLPKDRQSTRRTTHHTRSQSAIVPSPSYKYPPPKDLDDDGFEKDYILIESEFDHLRLKEPPRPKANPVDIPPTPNSSHSRMSPRDPSFDVLPIPKSLPKSLLGEAGDLEQSPQEKSSPPRFRPRKDSTSDGSQPGDGGWKVGSGAASVLANAISKATTKLFGTRGLSPPAAQYRTDTADPISFPLDGPSANDEECAVLHEMEKAACQAYALTKFADHKLDQLKREDFFESQKKPDVEEDVTTLSMTCQEAFLLYAKALGLLYLGFDNASKYWSKISHLQHDIVVSPRLSKASRWLQDKTNECLEKAEMVQCKMAERKFAITSYDTDILIYNFALNSCQDGVFKEIKGERILESETDYLMGLWMLQAIMFRAPQDPVLTSSDMENIRQMMAMVEDRLANFRKTLEELDLRQYALGHSFIPYSDGSRPSRT